MIIGLSVLSGVLFLLLIRNGVIDRRNKKTHKEASAKYQKRITDLGLKVNGQKVSGAKLRHKMNTLVLNTLTVGDVWRVIDHRGVELLIGVKDPSMESFTVLHGNHSYATSRGKLILDEKEFTRGYFELFNNSDTILAECVSEFVEQVIAV